MCIVIDINVLGNVFNERSSKHDEFKPVHLWIKNRNGKIVYGGTKYRKEIPGKYLGLFSEYEKIGKTVSLPDKEVDRCQKEVETSIRHRDFDDPHLIAIIAVSGCRLVCTLDKRAGPFIKDKSLYPRGYSRPKLKIYSGRRNANILCDSNIAPICRDDSS